MIRFRDNILFYALGFLLIISFFTCGEFWVNIINIFWVKPFMSQLGDYSYLLMTLFLIGVVIYYRAVFKYEKLVNKNRWKLYIIFLVIYFVCLFSGSWNYDCFFGSRWLSYSHFLLLPILLEVIFTFKIFMETKFDKKIVIIRKFKIVFKKSLKYIFKGKIRKLVKKIKTKIVLVGNFFIKIFKVQINKWVKPVKSQREPILQIEDSSYSADKDSYQRGKTIISNAKVLKTCFYPKQSFAVGITGSWGSGKTTYLNGLKNKLDQNKDIVVVDFEPWKCDSQNLIIKSFFELFRAEISKYAPNLSSTINDYALSLLEEQDYSKSIKMVSKILQCKSKGKTCSYDDISKKLEKINQKIVFVIDDIDRLDGKEILEVFRLIRNTANFPYIQFVMAYDKEYVIKSLASENIPKPETYLEKVINVEIPLPKFESRVICEELYNRISNLLISLKIEEIPDLIREMIGVKVIFFDKEPELLIPKILKTNRDVIRFYNSFRLILQCYYDANILNEISYKDLFYLELLRYKFTDVYDTLRDTPLFILDIEKESYKYLKKYCNDDEDYYVVDNPESDFSENDSEKEKKKFLEKKKDNFFEQDAKLIDEIMYILFENDNLSDNRIYDFRSYDKYFSFRLDSKRLSQTEFLDLINGNDILNKAEELYSKKEPLEFENQIRLNLDYLEPLGEEKPKLDYKVFYKAIEIMLCSLKLKDEIIKVIVPHINKLEIYSLEQLKEILKLSKNKSLINKISFSLILSSIFEKKELWNRLNIISDDDYKRIGIEYINDNEISELLSPAIYAFIMNNKNNDNSIVDLSKLKEIQLEYFKNNENKLDDKGYTLFVYCLDYSKIDYINGLPRKMYIKNEALDVMREFIGKNPYEYLERFIDQSNILDNIYIKSIYRKDYKLYAEPFYEQIYGSNEKFEGFLMSLESNTTEKAEILKRVKDFWELYKYNNYQPIEFVNQKNINDSIKCNFTKQMQELEELKDIDKILDNSSDEETIGDLKLRLDRNNLRISYKNIINDKLKKFQQKRLG